ncbi:uncharacterized protein G2W53_033628 [Senna tora]|uniref:Uncharacterized protein n=1 Tax=Senna tora TaxID=362788 RepID=A0A834T0F1_9FABA|nr:uncharacterized protein G2W53_033628 [Senna tora]
MLQLESSWHGRSLDHVSTYSGRQIAVGSHKPSGITSEKTCCASEPTRRFALYSRTGVVLMLQLELSWHGRTGIMSQHIPDEKSRSDLRNLHKLRGKTLVAQVSQTSRFALYSRTIVVLLLQLESSRHGMSVDHVNIFRMTNCGRILETFTNYEAKDLLRNVEHVSTYSEGQIVVGSQNFTNYEQKTCCASESNTSDRVVFANRSGFNAPIGVVMAWEERGSCLNILQTKNRGRISKPSRITRQNTCCASVSTRRFANRSGFDAPIRVVLAWEERGSCLNIFRMTITIGSQKPSRIERQKTCCANEKSRRSQKPSRTRQKTCCASESNTSVRVVFANPCGFDAPIGVVLAWEERGSCLNIFRTTNRGRFSETFTNYEAKDFCASESNTSVRVVFANQVVLMLQLESSWHGRSVDHVQHIPDDKLRSITETFTNYEAKDLLRKCGNMSVRVVFANRVVLMLQLESSWRGRSVDHVSTYSGRQIAVDLKTFTNYEAKYLLRKCVKHVGSRTGVVLMLQSESSWHGEERGSCLNNSNDKSPSDLKNLHELRGKSLVAQVIKHVGSQTGVVLMLQLESSWHGRSVDHVSTYSGRKIEVGSQTPSRITRQKTCCASESNTSFRVVFANRSGFDAPIGVVLAWEERGSPLNIFRTTNRGRISETFTNYEAKDFVAQSGFDAPIGVVLAWEERGSCLNIFRMTNRGRISETFTNYEAKDLLRKWVKHIGLRCIRESEKLHELRCKRHVAQVSQTRRIALYSRTGVVWLLQLESVLAWEERGSCLNISDDKSRSDLRNIHELQGKKIVAQMSQTRRLALYSRTAWF